MHRFNSPQTKPSHAISELTRVAHSCGLTLNALADLVKNHSRIGREVLGPDGREIVPAYGCSATQLSLSAAFPGTPILGPDGSVVGVDSSGRPKETYSSINRVVCEVIEEITSKPTAWYAPYRATTGPYSYTGPYRATRENWPKMLDGVPTRKIAAGVINNETCPWGVSRLRWKLDKFGISIVDLVEMLKKHENIANSPYTLGVQPAQISGASYREGKDVGNYQSITFVVAKAIEEITRGELGATKENWPRLTENMRVRRTGRKRCAPVGGPTELRASTIEAVGGVGTLAPTEAPPGPFTHPTGPAEPSVAYFDTETDPHHQAAGTALAIKWPEPPPTLAESVNLNACSHGAPPTGSDLDRLRTLLGVGK